MPRVKERTTMLQLHSMKQVKAFFYHLATIEMASPHLLYLLLKCLIIFALLIFRYFSIRTDSWVWERDRNIHDKFLYKTLGIKYWNCFKSRYMWVCISYACVYVSYMYAYTYISLHMHVLYYRYVHIFVYYLYVFIYSNICL